MLRPFLARQVAVSLSAFSLLLPWLTACGGGQNAEPVATPQAAAVDVAAEPADAAARTRAARYLSPTQAEQLDKALRGDVVWVPAPCCGLAPAELAVALAHALQAAKNLDANAAFIVDGPDARQVAAVANRLSDGGMTRVYAVVR